MKLQCYVKIHPYISLVLQILLFLWYITHTSCYNDLKLNSTLTHMKKNHFKFTSKTYNVTIPENSIGKTYAKPKLYDYRIGIEIHKRCDVMYRIVSGDRDKLFKAEERTVGNFAFLAIRKRTSNVVLNREKYEEYVLSIKAFVSCPELKQNYSYEDECTIYLQVLDRNDLSPLFYPTEYFVTIPEDIPIHSDIIRVSAEDADLGLNGEIYYSFLDDNAYFAIHPSTGLISNVRRLEHLGNKELQIVVLALDRGSASNYYYHQSSQAKVNVIINKANLFAPELHITTLESTTVNESLITRNKIYGIVQVSDRDDGRNGEIKNIKITSGDPNGNFYLAETETNGKYYIYLNKLSSLSNSKNVFNLTIQVEDGGTPVKYTSKLVSITVNVEKNNAPIFTRQFYEVSIPESSPSNMPVIRLKATDPDFGKNALVTLEIVGGNEGGEFRINPDTGMLYTQKLLDAEKTSFYTLTVSAIDQANLSVRKQSSAKVKINILDINDNDPQFDDNISTISLNENELIGSFVTKVSARDNDSGENSYISYSIANLNDLPFDIDHFSGIIRTSSVIDYEAMPRSYKLRVRASDWGLPFRRQTEKEILIKINNINDNRPQFERVNCIGKIFRHAPVGTDVLTLSAIDFDVGDYITYRLISGNEDGCFNLDPMTGIITIACDLKDMKLSHRFLSVSSTDGTHFSDEMTIEIRILGNDQYEMLKYIDKNSFSSFECHETGVAKKLADILAGSERNNMTFNNEVKDNEYALMPSRYGQNLHRPEFINFPLELKINESLTLGETITWFKAKDRDLGYNGKLIFGISEGDFDSVFRLDPESGELLLIGYLDRERQDEYVLNITVCDLGQHCKCDSKMLRVIIMDINDNPPVFQKSIVRFHLKENVNNSTEIFCLKANDADYGENALVTFQMKTESLSFGINSSSGCLFVNGPLDREQREEHKLEIIAKDKGYPSLSAESLITIIVDDVNDNAPTFGIQDIIFKVWEDLPKGTMIAQVEANDFDSDENGEIDFLLNEDTLSKSLFKIDKQSGVIRTKGYLDYENQQLHNLIVTAIDRGTPALTTTLSVVIEVIDVNENQHAPEFDDYVYTGKIKENKSKGIIAINISAKDLDEEGSNSEIEYFIHSGDGVGLFSVNERGSIRTLSHLDAESKKFYWLTLCARDRAIIPLVSCVQVYIEVENVNDNVPMTDKPVYYPSTKEGSLPNTRVMILNATDEDDDTTYITYKIISGNPEGFFEINGTTGELLTTERKLDRENQAEHILEILISDNGQPALYSTTRIVVLIEDVNDNAPQFEQRFYKVQVPSSISINDSITQIQATDNDIGDNGRITYSIKSGKGKNKFRIDPETGSIYVNKQLDPEGEYELIIKAEDNGLERKSQTARLNVVVIPILKKSMFPPHIKTMNNIVEVTESDKPGFLVTLIQATDEDGDHLWYNISGGNENNEFYVGRDNGNVLLSKPLDREFKNMHNLTISVSDGYNAVETELFVSVVDTNDNRPQFTKDLYVVNISESIKEESIIIQLHANDQDEEKKIFYTLHGSKDPTSLNYFRIDSLTGNVIVTQRLDYEGIKRHVLTVIAKDQGTPAKRNYAKIIVNVYDHNDHYPEFTSKILQIKIPESAAVKSTVVQLSAIDRDSGKNGEIRYHIVSGNIGNIFEIDSLLGTIYLAQKLDIMQMQEYMLQIKAVDCGYPTLSSQIPVHITVVMANNDPPKFDSPTTVELYENLPIGYFVNKFETRSSSSVSYNIANGNDEGFFYINPSTGVMLVNSKVDYEKNKQFNLTIKATNMASAKSTYNIIVHILDRNDNAPIFLKTEYYGEISEASELGTFVYCNKSSSSLIFLKTLDADDGQNSVLEYSILDEMSKKFFEIDSSTGTIRLLQRLDYESKTFFEFQVRVNDKGTPKLYSSTLASVYIDVLNVNDCSPEFTDKDINVTLYLPTYERVLVTQIKAIDMDTKDASKIRYDIVDGNTYDTFEINSSTGEITLRSLSKLSSFNTVHVRASDGLFSAIAQVDVNIEKIENPNFRFQKDLYELSTVENSTKIIIIGIVNLIGNDLDENVEYRILNPTKLFEIGKTSGAIKTKGAIMDRESMDKYILIIEATSVLYKNSKTYLRRAITRVVINIIDVNDNCPIFVNLPYYATVSIEDLRGTIILNIKAIDLDSNENGEVRYEMKKGNGELFKIDRKTGDISLKQKIEKTDKSYNIVVAAYDNALTPCYAEVPILIKVVDKSMPVFRKQLYSVSVREDVEMFSALSLNIQAESPLQRNLIFTISYGNDDEVFEIDYRTGVLFVVNYLDFEKKRSYELFVTATDSVSGVNAGVPVSILVEDANDCYPLIEKENYNITLSENTLLGSQILKITATDCDFEANSIISYSIESINGDKTSNLFYIDMAEGSLYLKHQLDYEVCKSYLIVITANDHGTPSLRSRANVWVKVDDINDNVPTFVEPSFSSKISISAKRDQFVTIAKAYDIDECDTDKLFYKVVDGNEHQLYSIDEFTGIITLLNSQRLQNYKQTILNISVTDGLHTTFARVKINLLPENNYSPIFEKEVYNAFVYENEGENKFIINVRALDNDFGIYSALTYEIIGDDMNAIFLINKLTGNLYSKVSLDREQKSLYDVIVKATDSGGKFGYTLVKVKVEDVNDNAPFFLLKNYNIIIKNDVKVKTVIAKITAGDIDENNNGALNLTFENSKNNQLYMEYLSLSLDGDLAITKPLQNCSTNLIEFFVRATDNGHTKQFYNILPVSLQILQSNILIPTFEKSTLNINVVESYAPGTILTKLKVNGNFSVKFSIATDTSKFSVTESGEIMLMQRLDRELSSTEHIIAMSQTATYPVLYAYIDIYFNVHDENDNIPKFSNVVYNVVIPENADKGSHVLKVTCTDTDEGPNGDVRYYLEDESYSKTFGIDIYTGWITLLTTLDRESKSEYYFNIFGSDNGDPKQISKVPIAITVTDCNDNPPIFKQTHQYLSISENVIPGTVLSRLLVTDMDLKKNTLDFFIVSGDNYCQFQISNTGELFVSNKLDRESIESYNISVAVTDGKFISYAYIFININDENDNFPVCLKLMYNILINESAPIGTALAKINALDIDISPNNKIRYYLTGNFSDDFHIEKNSGELKIAKELDREKQSVYTLLVHVQDGKELLKECISEVFISVNDVNDNKPEFSMEQYIVSIPEDARVNTIITKVHATDKDFGLNRKLSYSFSEENEFYDVNSSNGIVKLKKSLDRENISVFKINIKAEDNGWPRLFSTTNLIIHVLDINDNPPVFLLKQYSAILSEKATISSEVIKIHATSEDIGLNAEVVYYIIGGNEQQKFKIDFQTGVISVNSEIDYEKTKSFFLTVQAIDRGTPPLSTQAFVNITILDVNDNPPQFSQNLYRMRVSENAQKGEMIAQITAIDEDSDQNGILAYNIEKGDRLNQFSIDEFNGKIYVNNDLDRESISSYSLEIKACDKGLPQLCSFVQVLVEVLDINDNPPLFKQLNYSIVLQENKPLGFIITTFELFDADEFPNSSPFTFDFKSGNEGGYFRLEQDGSLRTAARFNHHICDQYVLQIRVFDNGIPPLYSDTWILIQIIEESQYPPVLTPLEITVNSYEDNFAGGFLGKIYVSDLDKYDTFSFELAPTHGHDNAVLKLFNISHETGELFAIRNLDVGLYQINITVSDGKFLSHAIVRVNVEIITNEMVRNSIIIRFGKVTPKDFILSHRKSFIRSIREIMRCSQNEVVIVALNHKEAFNENEILRKKSTSRSHSEKRHSYNVLEVVFTVQKQQIVPTSESYYSAEEIRYKVSKKLEEFEYSSNLLVEELVLNECLVNTCVHGMCKKYILLMKNNFQTYYTDVVSFVTPMYEYINNCFCKQGFDGINCDDPINACSSNPCTSQKQCSPADTATGYQCICPTGYSGFNCEIQAAKCQNRSCSNFKIPVSFSGKSYAHYKINKSVAENLIESKFLFSLNVRTVQQSGTLVYARGPVDYNIIEILNGALQYRFELGSGEGIVVVSSVNISDGDWHSIKLERFLNTAKLIVDNKHFAHGSTPGVNNILNLQSNDIFLGAEVKPHHTIIGYEDIHRGFIGCMTDLRIGTEMLPLYISGGISIAALKRFTNVEFHCDPLKVLNNLGICGSQPCLNSGFCQDLGDKFNCLCSERFSGPMCEIDLDPCASFPCLYGGRCEYFGPNNYSCICPSYLSGKRCEYGKFCLPNPCKNGGICEEGDGIPHCLCRGFTGTLCEIDVDECKNHPCGNGATCINEAGSFRCICPSYLTGSSCGDPLYSNSISTKIRNFSIENVTGIVCGVSLLFVFCTFLLLCITLKKNSSRNTRENPNRIKNTYKETTLNSLMQNEKNNKQNTKLSNLEVNHRPISYTQSSTDNMFSTNSHFVNNLDILRSYGSAGEELESIAFEYHKINLHNQNVNINNENNISDVATSSYKTDWCDQMQLKTFCENKLNNENRIDYNKVPLHCLPALKSNCGRLIQVKMPNVCQPSFGGEYSSIGQYHWDCSDWVRNSQNPLPDITEVPAEMADTSSVHSNESNGSKVILNSASELSCTKVNPIRDISTLHENFAFETVDSELQNFRNITLPSSSNSLLRLSPIYNTENEDYSLNSGKTYVRHPDTYLPPFCNLSETDGETSATEKFIQKNASVDFSRRKLIVNLEGEFLCRKSPYHSNISVHLCEIEDSELEEFLPRKREAPTITE